MSVRVESSLDPRLASVHITSRGSLRRRLASADGVLALFTLARLGLIPILTISFLASPAITTIALVLFIVADIYDGVLARSYDADGPRRRALDSTVDRLGIDAFLVAAFLAGALPGVLLAAFLMRDLYCAVICARMMREREVAIKADWLYRSLNLSVAAWAIAAPFLGSATRTAFAGVLLAASVVVAVDLTRSVRRVLAAPVAFRNGVADAAALRRGVARWHGTSAHAG